MRFYAIVLILNFQLTQIFAYPPNSHELSSQANYNLKGYECGNVFFTDDEIKKTLMAARASMDQRPALTERYQGKLYVKSESEDYFLYPIKKGYIFRKYNQVISTVFRVVFTRNSDEAVGVISKITIGDYAKCIQRGSTNIGPSNAAPEIPNGYLCGHEFFTDEIVQQNLDQAKRAIEEESKYLRAYIGHMYPEHIGHLMWPITKEGILYPYRKNRIGPYQLILSKEGEIVDVVVKGYKKNFLRCIRSRKPPKAPESDQHSQLFVPPPRQGYVCGKYIFNDAVLEQTAKMLQNQPTHEIKNKLIECSWQLFNQPCLIWPLFLNGKPFKAGQKGPYRLILTPQYKVLKVAMYASGKYKACERYIMKANKNHDRSNFHCNEKIFSHQHLLKAAKEACERVISIRRYNYPRKYDGPEFEKKGPYLTYPVFKNGVFTKNGGLDRVVINMSCEVVGALTTLKNGLSKRLVKCHRLNDGPLSSNFFGANAQTVFEH